MSEQWLIDGYNLLHALQERTSRKTPLSREQLLSRIAEFASSKKLSTLIILDGVGDNAEFKAYRTEHLDVVYSQKAPADSYIEKYLFEHRQERSLVVVTDDRAISNLARGGGARVLGTTAFAELLEEARKEGADYIQKERSRGHGFHRPFEDKL